MPRGPPSPASASTPSTECGGGTAGGTAVARWRRWSTVFLGGGTFARGALHGHHDNGQTPSPPPPPPAQDQPAAFRTPPGPPFPHRRPDPYPGRRARPSGWSIRWCSRQRQRRRALPAAPCNAPRFLYSGAGSCQHSSTESSSVWVAREVDVTASSALPGAVTQEGVSATHPVGTVSGGHHRSGTQQWRLQWCWQRSSQPFLDGRWMRRPLWRGCYRRRCCCTPGRVTTLAALGSTPWPQGAS